jgi:HEAT repeat protein
MENQVKRLFELLGEDSPVSDVAAFELLLYPGQLVGNPPSHLISALKSINYDSKSPFFELARQWESSPLSEALLETFLNEDDEQSKEHIAWLIKHLVGSKQWQTVASIASSKQESSRARRFLLEALDRLAFARQISWDDLKNVIGILKNDSASEVRDGIVGILMSLEDSNDKLFVLIDMLSDSNDLVVASAANGISQMKDIKLDSSYLDMLLKHPSLIVREIAKQIQKANL